MSKKRQVNKAKYKAVYLLAFMLSCSKTWLLDFSVQLQSKSGFESRKQLTQGYLQLLCSESVLLPLSTEAHAHMLRTHIPLISLGLLICLPLNVFTCFAGLGSPQTDTLMDKEETEDSSVFKTLHHSELTLMVILSS